MRSKLLPLCMAALLTGAGGLAAADDGMINNKSMSKTIQLPTFSQDIVTTKVPEAEHAFADYMKFYVPSQAASGLLTPIEYYNIDEDVLVETLEVAKPLINTFIYGPLFEPPGTAFFHSFADTYAAVSLDDGVTFKEVNLSESADLSSFNLDTDHNPSQDDPLPSDHNILLGTEEDGALHAKGYDTPYNSECTECHGHALQGTSQTPSCYSCHDNIWLEDWPEDLGPVIYQADFRDGTTLDIEGENAASLVTVTIINAISGEPVGTDRATRLGYFDYEAEYIGGELPPCVVAAEYTDANGIVQIGTAMSVVDPATGEPIENCEGSPLQLTEYPGGTYNVFYATAGNKTLVAWPSRFCEQGQPAYSMTTDNADETQQARLDAIVAFLQQGSTELGVPALPDFSMDNDLYLVDAFGVAGSQGSINFADEGYPQAGIVPFGCVWTARGILLPGDDLRTAEVESSHMVWTKAERLTSGRRDPNRIEVGAVKGAGFVVTWQEDPDGLRPGQGEGPGEGWSGAVAHPQTDVWYSFINEEYFDIVETVDNTTTPIDILDHDLTLSGRPQVFVPMAVPMRLTNNSKCNAPDDAGVVNDDLYCDYTLAAAYGLKNQCADAIEVITGPAENPDQQTTTLMCVVDSDGDGDADLPNRANTASTRPRTSLQAYDASADDKSAWVIMAVEESKGLGKFFFEPDGLLNTADGYADSCEEGSSLTCTEEIGKNAWYHSFDMGTPDTSAGIDQPNSLIENLVYQGDLLNQPEVYWETGEFYGLMDTATMGADGTSVYGDYDYEIVSTEIARRTSLLAQGIPKAMASANGLTAMPSWKQGTMRQGGPADTFLRRMKLPEGYGVDECTIDVDADQPVITSAVLGTNSAGSPVVRIKGYGADLDTTTQLQTRNAVTEAPFGALKPHNADGTFSYSVLATNTPPCAVQVADWDGTPAYGPWIAVVDAAGHLLPEGSCVGEIPQACGAVDICPIDVDPLGPYFTAGAVNTTNRLHVEGTGLDGLTTTRVVVRNAVTGVRLGGWYSDSEPDFIRNLILDRNSDGILQDEEVPCAIQAMDDLANNWGPIWEVTNAPAGCAGPLPAACSLGALSSAVLAAATEGIAVNPYGFENMVCEYWLIEAGDNPYYPKGVCADTPTNLSAVVPDTCVDDGAAGATIDCPTVDFTTSTFGIGDTNPILQGYEQGEGNTMRVLTWHQCPSEGAQITGDFTAVDCDTDDRTDDFVNLKDQSWYNPLDISKGHRGFIDGDFVMFLYAWSPNWRLNAKGSDRYDLYIRRSFDGGETWKTTPSSFAAADGVTYAGDGTVTCESYRSTETGTGEPSEPKVCYDFAAGVAEHARNVTQHKSMNITTLDPRFAITGSPRGEAITDTCTDGLFLDEAVIEGIFTCDDLSEVQDTDARNASRYFVVFETGDNNTVVDGEAEPLDLFYSRAESFGDDYVVWTETDTDTADATLCYPSDPHEVVDVSLVVVGSGFCNEFDNLNTGGDTHSSEASLAGDSAGTKLYGVWAQWVFANDDDYESEVIESDAMARRIWWLDDYVSDTNAYTLPGTQTQ